MNAPAGAGLEAGSSPPFHTEGEHDDHHHYPGSEAMRKMTVNKISTLQALTISGLELALTLGNALKKEAFQFSSGSDLIFGGSALIETVGFLFAIWMALIALFRPPSAGNAVGSGVRPRDVIHGPSSFFGHEQQGMACFFIVPSVALSAVARVHLVPLFCEELRSEGLAESVGSSPPQAVPSFWWFLSVWLLHPSLSAHTSNKQEARYVTQFFTLDTTRGQ